MIIKKTLLLVLLLGPMMGCVVGGNFPEGKRLDAQFNLVQNSPSTVGPFEGRVLAQSPILINRDARPQDALFRFVAPPSGFYC